MPSEYANDLMARVGLDTTEWKKGITDLNSGIKHIETGFQATAALMDDWSNSSEGLKKRIETLNDKLALQKKKLDTLKQAYEEEVNANGEGSKGAEELAKKMYSAQQEIQRTQVSIEKYNNKLSEMGVFSEKNAKKLDSLAASTRKLSAASAAGLAAIGAGIYKAASNADDLNTLAQQTGLTTAEIQKFQYASEVVDVSVDTITGALRKMTKNMDSTSADVQEAWKTIGVSPTDAAGKMRDTTEVFYEALEGLSKIRNETERDQVAMYLFGKSANDLAGIVDDGGKALKELGEEAEKAGLIMSQDTIDGANKLNDTIDKLKATVQAEFLKAFSDDAGKLTEEAEDLAKTLTSALKTILNLPSPVKKTGVAVLALSATISPLLSSGANAIRIINSIKKLNFAKNLANTTKAFNATKTAAAGTTTALVETKTAATGATMALTKTEISANGAATGITAVGKATNTAIPILGAIVLSLKAVKAIADKYEENRNKAIDKKYDKLIEKSNKSYDKEIKNINTELKTKEKALNQEIYDTEVYYDNLIKQASEYEKTERKSIEKQKEALKEAHTLRLAQLKEEYDAQVALLEQQQSSATAPLQAQIDAIDALTAAEDEAEKERSNKEKLRELEENILNASSLTERQQAQKAYSDFVADLEKEQTRKKREEEKNRLKNQIETINSEINAEKSKLETEYNDNVDNENDKYETDVKALDDRLEYLDDYINQKSEKLEEDKNKEIKRIQDETEAYIDGLNDRLDELEKAKEEEKKILNKKRKEEKETSVDNYTSYVVPFEVPTQFEIPMGLFGRIPSHASGTDFWRGGLTRINEEGGEILNLPRGTQIIPHDVSVEAAKEYARAVTNNTTNADNRVYNNYGAQQHVTKVEIGGRSVGEIIEPTVSNIMAIKIEQRKREGHAY